MILTVTLNTSIDKLYLMTGIRPETVMRVTEVHNTAGGKGLNVSRVAAKLGETVTAVGFVGGFNGRYLESLVDAFGAGIGFLFAMIIMAGVRSKLVDQSRIPESFRGVPIVLITAAILSLSFMGFNGMFS